MIAEKQRNERTRKNITDVKYAEVNTLRFTGDPKWHYANQVVCWTDIIAKDAREKSLPLGKVIAELAYGVADTVRKEHIDGKIICSDAGGYDGQDCIKAVYEGFNRLIQDIHDKLEGMPLEKKGREFLDDFVKSINNGERGRKKKSA